MSAAAAVRARALNVPAAVWVAGIVVVSIGVRVALARRIVAPWIMVDEIVYSELAKSFAAHGDFLVRGVPSRGYGVVYPVLIAPAWRLFGAIPSVYTAAKAINSVLMSLAGVPAYFLARRVLPQRLAIVAAGLSLLVPSMLYTGMLMTENAYYPIFLAFALLLLVTLERPTMARQVGLVALFALAYETRAQSAALIPALATAPVLYALMRREGLRRGLAPFRPLYGILAGGALIALAAAALRGRSPLGLLGAYDAATTSTYTVSGIAHFLLYHLAEFDLYVGIVPFAALVAVWLGARRPGAPLAAFAAATASISIWLVAEVAAFASQSSVDRIEERNMFYLAPFALVALLALRVEGLVPRRGRPALAAAALAGVLPFLIPFTRFITTSAVSDTFALLPWWWVQDHWISLGQVRYAAGAVALAGAAVFLWTPRRLTLLLAGLVAGYFVATAAVVDNGRHGIHVASVGSLWAGSHLPDPGWIDRAVGPNAEVLALWTGTTSPYPIWEDEFFNRSVRNVVDLDAQPADPLPQRPATRSPSGVVVLAGGQPLQARYVLADSTIALAGTLVKPDPVGLSLYRVDGPVVVLTHVSGLYPLDTWSGRSVTYQRVECAGGSLAVQLKTDKQLFRAAQTVVASEDGRVVGRVGLPPGVVRVLRVPLLRGAGNRCSVRFTVAYTLVPARVEHGSSDPRALGAHFLVFGYRP